MAELPDLLELRRGEGALYLVTTRGDW